MSTPKPSQTPHVKYIDTVGFVADQGGRGFHLPVAISVRADGKIFVVSRSHEESLRIVGIQVVSLRHDFFKQIGTFGVGDGQMTSPSAIALDSEGFIYLADEALQRITIYDPDGRFLTKWGTAGKRNGEIDGPAGLAFDRDDNLLVVDHKNHRVQKFTKAGKFLSTFGSFGDGKGEFNLPWGIDLDDEDNIYVADWRNDRIQKFAYCGNHIAEYTGSGTGTNRLNRPSSVTVDSDGNMYIADWGNQQVQILDRDGTFLQALRGQATLSRWASEYLEANTDEFTARSTYVPVFEVDTDDLHEESSRIEPYFWDPVAVTLDEQARLYVLETGRHRFQVYGQLAACSTTNR